MSLTLSAQPGFTELPDSDFDAGNVASDTNMKALNAASKFGVVRNEQVYQLLPQRGDGDSAGVAGGWVCL